MKKVLLSLFLICSSIMSFSQTTVTFYTTQGDFVVEIYDNIVPITGGNFLDLMDSNFYDGVIFHRVISGFMIQGGDPTGTGSGGPGYNIQDEFDPSLSNVQTTISMANTGQPNSGGSQFFINLVNNTHLDYNKAPLSSAHAVFGKVIENFSVVQTIGQVATNSSDRPLTDVVMDSIRRGNGLHVGLDPITDYRDGIRAYPNPANSKLNIDGVADDFDFIELTNYAGQTVLKTSELNNGSIDISNLEIGVYVLRIFQNGKSHTEKIVISR